MGIGTAIAARFEQKSDFIEQARAEFNYDSIHAHIPDGAKVLDVGAWRCHLGGLLRDRKHCRVLNLDVIDANRTEMPVRIFDGAKLPVESAAYDAVLLLYVLHHASDDEPLLREARRVVRDGGCVLVAEDSVNGLWDRIVTLGFHLWLRLVTGMTRDGTFRTTAQWRERFHAMGFTIKETVSLGHHLGRFGWPNNILFVLERAESKTAS
jgi:SAM-dependent methyltransferase